MHPLGSPRMNRTDPVSPELSALSVGAQNSLLREESRLTRSRSAELRLHAQELRARSVTARDMAAEGYLRARFVSVLREPLPKRLRDTLTCGPPMRDDELNTQAAKLKRTVQRAREISQAASHTAGKLHDEADKAHRRAEQAHARTEAAHQHAEEVHAQVDVAHQHAEDARQQLEPQGEPPAAH